MSEKKTGEETFQYQNALLPLSVLDFWQWVGSDFLDNALRGKIAEFLEGNALSCLEETRKEWDAFDLITCPWRIRNYAAIGV